MQQFTYKMQEMFDRSSFDQSVHHVRIQKPENFNRSLIAIRSIETETLKFNRSNLNLDQSNRLQIVLIVSRLCY
jgi:hypothetical protein